ncbi:xanthine dehydrogenase accessory protein XdhC [Oryzicola mucosus]|uniref:Xanthine dehydrogenase accessory protein XdhC n=1 Tax=Oryzicola mucosus TaxID=2767425 RepID=A0A8J6PU15_9HYPH|nr:xanthine dehydrogenase accessory protein XdhC [Oryzicola mucosus]MBD0414331.1 xanthine dehydrogenase accessory protein XdhC [Oryzicola mucosus]
MTSPAKSLRAFLDVSPSTALVQVTEAQGSTPREQGAWMLVSPAAIYGTIGGGQLEFMAIDRAREMLADALPSPLWGGSTRSVGLGVFDKPEPPPRLASSAALRMLSDPPLKGEGKGGPLTLDIPLGPEIGQCCGGRVLLTIRLCDDELRAGLITEAEVEDEARPRILVFGGGHVGQALALAFALLPVHVVLVETRADALEGMPAAVETRLTAVPEAEVRDAPQGAAYVVLTHDHALDFLIVAEALKRLDACYVGMIGSKTKKATFKSWYLKTAGGDEAAFARLVSPIGGNAVNDKRPAVIAALAAAEIMTALSR